MKKKAFDWIIIIISAYLMIHSVLLFTSIQSCSDTWVKIASDQQIQYHKIAVHHGYILVFKLSNGDVVSAGDTLLADAGFDLTEFDNCENNTFTVKYTKIWDTCSPYHCLISIISDDGTSPFNENMIAKTYTSYAVIVFAVSLPFFVIFMLPLKLPKKKRKK